MVEIVKNRKRIESFSSIDSIDIVNFFFTPFKIIVKNKKRQ